MAQTKLQELLHRGLSNDPHEVERLLKITSATSLKSLGDSAMTETSYAAAINFYSKALALIPGNPVLLSNRAAAYTSSGYMDFALADAAAAVRAHPRYSIGWSRLGLARMYAGDPTGSLEAFEKAIAYDGSGGTDAMKKGYETTQQVVAKLERGRLMDVPARTLGGILIQEPLDDGPDWIPESYWTGSYAGSSRSNPGNLQRGSAATEAKKKMRKSFFGRLKEKLSDNPKN